MLASSSPECFVGRHVLLRLYVPRYPPLALSRLTCFWLDFFVCYFHWLLFSLGQWIHLHSWLLFFYAVFKVRYWRWLQHSVFGSITL